MASNDNSNLTNPLPYWPHQYMPFISDFTTATESRSNGSSYRAGLIWNWHNQNITFATKGLQTDQNIIVLNNFSFYISILAKPSWNTLHTPHNPAAIHSELRLTKFPSCLWHGITTIIITERTLPNSKLGSWHTKNESTEKARWVRFHRLAEDS